MMIAEPSRVFNHVVGIDLGGGKGKHTAVALGVVTAAGLEIRSYGLKAPSGLPWYDEPLVSFLLEQPPGTLVAVDAPLGLPACLRCDLEVCPGFEGCPDPAVRWMMTEGDAMERELRSRASRHKPRITPYTQRVCEILLRCSQGIQPRETLGQGMGPLTARAAHLVRALAGRYRPNRDLIEVYPKATLHQLAGGEVARRYKREPDVWAVRAGILEQLGQELSFRTWREESLRNDHCFDAVLCAYTAHRFSTDGWMVPGGFEEIAALEGWIWFPPSA